MCSAAMGDGRGGRLSIGDGMGWFGAVGAVGAVAMDGGWWMDSTQSTREEGMYWPWDGRGAGCWLLAAGPWLREWARVRPSRLLSRQTGEHSYLPTYLHTYVCMYYVLCIVLTYMHTRAACLLEEDE